MATTRRKFDNNQKATAVILELKGKPIANICNEYGIRQSVFYRWKDKFMSNINSILLKIRI